MHRLIQRGALINGSFIKSSNGSNFKVFSPRDQSLICEVSDCDSNDTIKAIEVAENQFKSWCSTSGNLRSQYLQKLVTLLKDNQKEISEIITSENGKNLSDAMAETSISIDYLDWFCGEARRLHGGIFASSRSGLFQYYFRQPIGVVAIIVPFNFPLSMICRSLGAALAAGCVAIIKPSEETPLSALAIGSLIIEAGFPKGVVQVLPCSKPESVVDVLCESDLVRKMSFTGSIPVGKMLLSKASSTVKKMSMELGGNAPFIVFESADLKVAVQGLLAGKMRCSGQTCISPNRIFLQSSVYDDFISILLKQINSLPQIAPLINEKAVRKIESIISQSVEMGAKIIIGGKSEGLYFEPTILTDVTSLMPCYTNEIFGPVIPILKFDEEEMALSMANSMKVGLAGYFFSKDLKQISRVSKQLEVGMIGVNEGLISCPEAPFGGVKESGLGLEGSKYGVDEYLNTKYICQGDLL